MGNCIRNLPFGSHPSLAFQAKADASSRGQWLMVNVQKTDEFACQALNRDVWNNSAVQELIRSNFILWQVNCLLVFVFGGLQKWSCWLEEGCEKFWNLPEWAP